LDRVLGLLILAVYVVVRIFPVKDKPQNPEGPSDDGTGESQGRLFRRSKRAEA
jgi:hypothetical protein